MTPAVTNSPSASAEADKTGAREFEAMFREHADLVFGTAYGITRRREDAEDVVQTVFIRLWQHDVRVQSYKSPNAYLYRAAINQSLNILKTRKRHPTTDLTDTDLAADTNSSEREEVLQRKLYEAIARLPAEAAEVLILRYLHGYTDVAIATLLGKSRVTVAVRLHRAKAQLKRLLRLSLGEELMKRKQDPLEEFLSRHVDPLKNGSQRLAEADKERLLKNILSAGMGQQPAPSIPPRGRSLRFLLAAAAVLVAIAVFSWNLQRLSRSEVSLNDPKDKGRVLAAGLVLPAAENVGLLRGTVLDNGSSSPISDVHIFIGRGAADPGSLDSLTKVISSMSNALANLPRLEETLQDMLNDPKDEELRNGSFKLLTGSDGHFTIQNMPAGPYTVVAYRQGYVGAGTLAASPEFGGASLIALATVQITSQQTSEVTLKLAQGGALNGRVIGRDGKPRANIDVAVSQVVYDERTGAPRLWPVKEGKSDDRGEFRIFHIPPGEYYLVASVPVGKFGKPVLGEIVETYYPSATSTKDTRPIAIRAGDDLAGFDIHLQTVPRFAVSGRVISLLPADGPLPEGTTADTRNLALLRIVAREENPNWGREMSFAPASGTADVAGPTNGAFEVGGIPPGSYDVYATMADVRGATGGYYNGIAYGRTAFEVRNRNVSGITVTVHRSLDLSGQVFVDGSPSAAPVRLQLQPIDSAAGMVQLTFFGRTDPTQIRIERDGSFIIHGVPAVTFRPQATIKGDGLPASAYVADIRQGGRSVYDDGFTAGPAAASPLEVLVNTRGGTVEGVVDRAKALVAMVPPPGRRQNGDLYKTMTTNAQRQFRFEGVPPGSYKLFAWENIPANAYRNKDFLKAYESRGVPITVQAGAAVFQKLEVSR